MPISTGSWPAGTREAAPAPMRFRGIVYRAHDPRWSWPPASGEGARLHGGRFNRVGVPAFYASVSPVTAIREASALGQPLQPKARGRTLPWGLLRESIRAGVKNRWLAVAEGSVAVDCGYDEAGQLQIERPAAEAAADPPRPTPSTAGALLEGSRIQDLAELVPKLLETSAGHDLRFRVSAVLEADTGGRISQDVRDALDDLLAQVADDLTTE